MHMSGYHRFVINMGVQLGSSIISTLLSFIFIIYIANSLNVNIFGKFSTVQLFVTAFLVFTDLGLTNVVIREIARDKSQLSYITENMLSLKLLLGLLTFTVIGMTGIIIGYQQDTQLYIWIYGLYVIPYSVISVCVAIFNGHERMIYSTLPTFGIIIGYIGSIAAIHLGFGLGVVFGIMVFSTLSVTVISLVIVHSRFTKITGLQINLSLWRDYLTRGFPFGIITIAGILGVSLGPITLSRLSGEVEVGYYNSAYKIISAFMLVVAAYNAAIFPIFSRLESTSKTKLYQGYKLSMKLMLMVGLPFAVGLTVLSRKIFMHVFPSYLPAIPMLQSLSWFLFFSMLATPVLNMLYAEGRQKDVAKILIIASCTSVVFSLLLIPLIGGIAIGIALTIMTALQFVLGYSRIYHKYALNNRKIALQSFLIAFAIFLVGILFHYINLYIEIILMIVIFIIGIFVLKVFDASELGLLSNFPILSRITLSRDL